MTAWPVVLTACADCGVGTITLGEYYMVKDSVWDEAWSGRRKWWFHYVGGQETLCIGCLENRIGRTLMACDFTDCEVNDPTDETNSKRLRARLTAKEGSPLPYLPPRSDDLEPIHEVVESDESVVILLSA
jgi:hypothetical protein